MVLISTTLKWYLCCVLFFTGWVRLEGTSVLIWCKLPAQAGSSQSTGHRAQGGVLSISSEGSSTPPLGTVLLAWSLHNREIPPHFLVELCISFCPGSSTWWFLRAQLVRVEHFQSLAWKASFSIRIKKQRKANGISHTGRFLHLHTLRLTIQCLLGSVKEWGKKQNRVEDFPGS